MSDTLFDLERTYPHCRHCAWGSEHHPDHASSHATPCSSGCEVAA